MRTVIVLALLAAVARGLEIHATDAETGAVLDRLRCAVLRGDRVVARFKGTGHAGPVEADDVLRVYCRGYDLATAPAAGAGPVRVAMRRTQETCTLVCESTDAGAVAQVSVTLKGSWKTSPIEDTYHVPLNRARTKIAVPRGCVTRLYLTAGDAIASPIGGPARAGLVVRVHVDQPRTIPVRYGEGDGSFAVFRDLLWKPDVSPRRIDAWRWNLSGPGPIAEELANRRPRVTILPDVPRHVFGAVGGVPLYRRIAIGQAALDVAPAPLRRIVVAPVVDGQAVAPGALVAPGRLDLYTIATLGDEDRLESCFVRVVLGPWAPVALPAADWLTTWHPDTGLAHLAWTDLDPPRGHTAPAWIRIRVPEGRTARGTVSLFPVWGGAGTVRSGVPDHPFRRRLDGERRAVPYRGLVPGNYGMQLAYTLRGPDGSEVRVNRMHEIAIPKHGRDWTLPVK